MYGPPNEKESHPTGGVYQQPGASSLVKFPSEKWMYRWIQGVGQNVIIEFVDQNNDGTFRMTQDPNRTRRCLKSTRNSTSKAKWCARAILEGSLRASWRPW